MDTAAGLDCVGVDGGVEGPGGSVGDADVCRVVGGVVLADDCAGSSVRTWANDELGRIAARKRRDEEIVGSDLAHWQCIRDRFRDSIVIIVQESMFVEKGIVRRKQRADVSPSLDVGLVLVDRHDLWQRQQAVIISNNEIGKFVFEQVNGVTQDLTTASCRRAGKRRMLCPDPDIH